MRRDISKLAPASKIESRRNFAEDIKNFRIRLANFHLACSQPPDFNPSNIANIYSSLFPIHPVSRDTRPPKMQKDDWDAGCPICADEWDVLSRKVIVQLHCDHFMHYACIRKEWDKPDKQTFLCPLVSCSHISSWIIVVRLISL